MLHFKVYRLFYIVLFVVSLGKFPVSFAQESTHHLIKSKLELLHPYWIEKDIKQKERVYILMTLEAAEIPDREEKTPLNLSLVLDRSGSMKGAKLANAKGAANYIIDQIQDSDFLSIITYDDFVEVISPGSNVKNKKKLKAKIDDITHQGTTNLSGGMFAGYQEVLKNFRPDYVNHVMLLSDGLANKGITDPYALKDTVWKKNRFENITLSTFGIGSDFDEDLMEDLADQGGGYYYFVERAIQISNLLKQEMEELQNTTAQNIQTIIDYPAEKLEFEGIWGFPASYDSTGLVIQWNDLYEGQKKKALLSFKVVNPDFKQIEFVGSTNYTNHQSDLGIFTLSTQTTMYKTEDANLKESHVNAEVKKEILLSEANLKLSEAINKAGKEELNNAAALAKEVKLQLEKVFESIEPDSTLLRQYETTKSYINHIKLIDGYTAYDKKMMQKNTKSKNYQIRKQRPWQY